MEHKRMAAVAAVVLGLAAPARAETPFSQAMVSITLDDGYLSQYTLGRPALNARGYHGTFNLITDALLNWGGYMKPAQAQQLVADGHEIASHTVTHPNLTTVSDAALQTELAQSQATLASTLGLADVTDLALPYGAYDARVLAAVKTYYLSSRTTQEVQNYRDTSPYLLGGYGCTSTTTAAQLTSVIDQAIASRSWAILYFHDLFSTTTTDPWACSLATFTAVLDYLAQNNVRVVTVREGVALLDGAAPPPPPPAVALTGLSPGTGTTSGGTQVTLTGTGFVTGATVTFGGTTAVVRSLSASSIAVTTPAHAAGAVDVAVRNPDGQTVSLANGFTYRAPAPTLSSISPTSGTRTGGTAVTLRGTGFQAGATVTFGGTAAVVRSVSASSIAVTTPAHAVGYVAVKVTNADGQSVTRNNAYLYR